MLFQQIRYPQRPLDTRSNMLSLSFHLRPIMTLYSHFQVLGEKSWLGPYHKSTSHAINIWKRSVQWISCSKRLVKSCSKRYDISDLGHFWWSYDDLTVISVRFWKRLIRFFVPTQINISTIDHIRQTLFEPLVKSYSKWYGVLDLIHFWWSYDDLTVISVRFGKFLSRFFALAQMNIEKRSVQWISCSKRLVKSCSKGMIFLIWVIFDEVMTV
jgi:hypothetical protein